MTNESRLNQLPPAPSGMVSLSHINRRRGLLYFVWKLLRLRLVIFISGFRRAKLRRKIGTIILGLVILTIFGAAFAGSWMLLRFLRSPQIAQFIGDPRLFLENVPVLVLGTSAIGILFTSFGVLLQALYLAGDMEFLLSAPVPIRAVFIAKLLQAILPNFGLIGLLGLPVLYGLGISGGYNFIYYPLVLIVMVALALSAAGISSLLVMGIVRIVPARRVAEVLGFFGAIVSILCSQSGQFTSSINFSELAKNIVPGRLGVINQFNSPFSPFAWAGRALVDIGEGRWLTGLVFLGLTLGISAGVFLFSLNIAERLYYTGWANMQASPKRKKPACSPGRRGRVSPSGPTLQTDRFAKPSGGSLRVLTNRLLPSALRGIVWKDFLVIRRDLRNLSQVITPLIFGIIYAFMLIRSGGKAPTGRGEAPDWFMQSLKTAMIYGNVAISLFVGWSLLQRLALMGFSQEGKYYWILKSAPVSSGKLLLAKFAIAYLPTLSLSLLFLVIISLLGSASLGVFLYGLPVVALSLAGMAGINLAFGVKSANLAWEDPRQMARATTGCLSALSSAAYLGVSLVIFFLPAIGFPALGLPELFGQVLGLVLGSSFCLACAFLPPWAVRKAADHLGEV